MGDYIKSNKIITRNDLPYKYKKIDKDYWKEYGSCNICNKEQVPVEHCELCNAIICKECTRFLYDNINYILDPYDTIFGKFCEKCFNKLKDIVDQNNHKLFEYS